MEEQHKSITLICLRHGQTSWNTSKRIQGHTDISITEETKKKLTTQRIPSEYQCNRWLVSPLKRTHETAQALGLLNYSIHPNLIEMNWGNWEGMTLKELRQTQGEKMAINEAKGLDFRPEKGESPRDVQNRLVPLLKDLVQQGKSTGIVTHKGVLRALYALATGWDMKKKEKDNINWNNLHLFEIRSDLSVAVIKLNIALASKNLLTGR